MKQLTASEISDLIERLGSFTQVGLAAACEGRANPKDWAADKERPTSDEMQRLVVLKESMDRVARKRGRGADRQWAIGSNCLVDGSRISPIMAVSLDEFQAVRDAAR